MLATQLEPTHMLSFRCENQTMTHETQRGAEIEHRTMGIGYPEIGHRICPIYRLDMDIGIPISEIGIPIS